MKIAGVDPKTLPSMEYLALPRGEQEIVLTARGLPDMDEFEKMCPEPKMPVRMTRDGSKPNPEEPGYKAAMEEYNRRRLAYLVIKSLEPSDIEWDTVDFEKPGTWANWEKDLKNSGFSQVESNLILKLVFEANQLDEQKLKKARDAFLRGLQPA